MPFGKKKVGERRRLGMLWRTPRFVDFDWIYEEIFEPAIRSVALPEGGNLVPRRTDRDFVSGVIDEEMFHLLEYSRYTLADITSLNFNVAYELGLRHRARESGTAIFRQLDVAIPFDVSRIRIFSYQADPAARISESKRLVTRVLQESLDEGNRIDSPVQLALRAQEQKPSELDEFLRQAEQAIQLQQWADAIGYLRRALAIDPKSALLQLRLGLLYKEVGAWPEALSCFNSAVVYQPSYAEALREKGIAENKLASTSSSGALPSGEESLQAALSYQPDDYDALASLGGIYKRAGQYEESFALYRRATEASFGHSYPLLNEIVLQARAEGHIPVDERRRDQLRRARVSLHAQVSHSPPYNTPWSYFDLGLTEYFLGSPGALLNQIEEGVPTCSAAWQARTFRETLELLVAGGVHDEALQLAVERLAQAEKALPGQW